MLSGGLQDFPSPSPPRQALPPKKKEEKASVKVSTSLKAKTNFTWEPQSVTVQSNSLAGLTPTVSTHSAPMRNHRSWSKHASRGSRKQLLRNPTLWQA